MSKLAYRNKTPFKCLILSKKLTRIQKELSNLKQNTIYLKYDIDGFKDSTKILRLAEDNNCNTFIAFHANNETQANNEYITMGRIFNKQILNIMQFKIIDKKDSTCFSATLPSELFSKFIIITFNCSSIEENFFTNLFGIQIQKIDLYALKYVLVIIKTEQTYEIKYVRILSYGYEELGPNYKLLLQNEYFNEELFSQTIPKRHVKQKNIIKTPMKDIIGKLYISKQNLNEIKTKYKQSS